MRSWFDNGEVRFLAHEAEQLANSDAAIVTESVFRWPGIGALSVDALLNRDGPILMGTVILTSIAVVVATVLVDVAYGVLDPRIRRR